MSASGNAYYRGIGDVTGGPGRWTVAERWDDVEPLLDLRADDAVLDIGCAEGLLTFNVAAKVRHVMAFDVDAGRIEAANRLCALRNVSNVTFAVGSIVDRELDEQSFDVVLFLGVMQHLPPEHQMPSFARCLRSARRQVAVRTSIHREPNLEILRSILRVSRQEGFETTCLAQTGERGGNLLIANRIGADVRFDVGNRPLVSV